MKRNLTLSLLFFLACLNCKGQTLILKKFVDKVNSCKNISYTSFTNNESPLGDGSDTIKTFQTNNTKGTGLKFEFETSNGKDVFNGKKLLMLDYKNKVYSINNDYTFSPSYFNSLPLFKLIEVISKTAKLPQKVKLLPDTTFNSTACFHIKISIKDTIVRKNQVYDIYDIYLSRISYLPVYAENNSQGYIEKGGIESTGVYKEIIRNIYTNYMINQKTFLDLTALKIPAGFISETEFNNSSANATTNPLPLLSPGSKAPEWTLQDLDGNTVSSNKMSHKVLVIDFFDAACAPCIMAIPVLNKLHEKYKNAEVKFISIDMSDTKEVALKFVNKYKIMAPVCINGRAVGDNFHVAPIPTFYLIDKQGNVALFLVGYGDELEQNLTAQIDKLR